MMNDSPDKVRLFALRSFGESLYHSITDASLEFGFKSIFAVGGTKPETLQKRHIMHLAQYYGGEIRIVAGHGINSVLAKRTKDIIEKEKYFYTSFDNGLWKNLN